MQRPKIVRELKNVGRGTQIAAFVALGTGYFTGRQDMVYAFVSVFFLLFSSVFFALDYCCQVLESLAAPTRTE